MKTAIELIAEERKRQIEAEGWTPEHDDRHKNGQLATAAACYALAEGWRNKYKPLITDHIPPMVGNTLNDSVPIWPWDKAWWKPTPDDPIRELVKCGALIVAEIERRQRIAGQVQEVVDVDEALKKLVYLFTDGNYSNVVFQDLGGITAWIEADTETLKPEDPNTEDYEYTIKLGWMTQEEIDNLPEAE
jgi:hypothetical protein